MAGQGRLRPLEAGEHSRQGATAQTRQGGDVPVVLTPGGCVTGVVCVERRRQAWGVPGAPLSEVRANAGFEAEPWHEFELLWGVGHVWILVI